MENKKTYTGKNYNNFSDMRLIKMSDAYAALAKKIGEEQDPKSYKKYMNKAYKFKNLSHQVSDRQGKLRCLTADEKEIRRLNLR